METGWMRRLATIRPGSRSHPALPAATIAFQLPSRALPPTASSRRRRTTARTRFVTRARSTRAGAARPAMRAAPTRPRAAGDGKRDARAGHAIAVVHSRPSSAACAPIRGERVMKNKAACLASLLAGSLSAATAAADYLAPDPGTQISIQYNSGDVIVVRPVGGVWSHPLCPDVTAAVLSPRMYPPTDRNGYMDYSKVYDLLVNAALQGRTVNLRVSDTECHPNCYPLIVSLRIFP